MMLNNLDTLLDDISYNKMMINKFTFKVYVHSSIGGFKYYTVGITDDFTSYSQKKFENRKDADDYCEKLNLFCRIPREFFEQCIRSDISDFLKENK